MGLIYIYKASERLRVLRKDQKTHAAHAVPIPITPAEERNNT